MYPDHCAFPAFFYFDDDGISIEFPDLPGCLSCAHTTEEAFYNAKEALSVHLFGMEQDNDPLPTPTPAWELHPEDGVLAVMVEVFMPYVRAHVTQKVVQKTMTFTLPVWLNMEAEAANADFSQILQDGLMRYLGKTAGTGL